MNKREQVIEELREVQEELRGLLERAQSALGELSSDDENIAELARRTWNASIEQAIDRDNLWLGHAHSIEDTIEAIEEAEEEDEEARHDANDDDNDDDELTSKKLDELNAGDMFRIGPEGTMMTFTKVEHASDQYVLCKHQDVEFRLHKNLTVWVKRG